MDNYNKDIIGLIFGYTTDAKTFKNSMLVNKRFNQIALNYNFGNEFIEIIKIRLFCNKYNNLELSLNHFYFSENSNYDRSFVTPLKCLARIPFNNIDKDVSDKLKKPFDYQLFFAILKKSYRQKFQKVNNEVYSAKINTSDIIESFDDILYSQLMSKKVVVKINNYDIVECKSIPI